MKEIRDVSTKIESWKHRPCYRNLEIDVDNPDSMVDTMQTEQRLQQNPPFSEDSEVFTFWLNDCLQLALKLIQQP
ncbi:MAG: hypothetical protein VCF25_30105, partial [Candidatus Poribacteria bacterium]